MNLLYPDPGAPTEGSRQHDDRAGFMPGSGPCAAERRSFGRAHAAVQAAESARTLPQEVTVLFSNSALRSTVPGGPSSVPPPNRSLHLTTRAGFHAS